MFVFSFLLYLCCLWVVDDYSINNNFFYYLIGIFVFFSILLMFMFYKRYLNNRIHDEYDNYTTEDIPDIDDQPYVRYDGWDQVFEE